jgi:hypothetical protein
MGEPVTTGIMIGAALGGGGAALKGQDHKVLDALLHRIY